MHTNDPINERSGSIIAVPHDAAEGALLTVPDAHLLFSAEFKRVGPDLLLTGDDG